MKTTTSVHWSEVLGNYVTAVQVVREYHADTMAGKPDLAGWLELRSMELWGPDHERHNWRMLARQIEREGMHGDWTLDDVAAGLAEVVRCPDCGQMEIWCAAELEDHGYCRAQGDRCPVCG